MLLEFFDLLLGTQSKSSGIPPKAIVDFNGDILVDFNGDIIVDDV